MGELSAETLQCRGVRGYIVDGGCRDTAFIRKIGFPVFATRRRRATSSPPGRPWPTTSRSAIGRRGRGLATTRWPTATASSSSRARGRRGDQGATAAMVTENKVRAAILEGVDPKHAYLQQGKFYPVAPDRASAIRRIPRSALGRVGRKASTVRGERSRKGAAGRRRAVRRQLVDPPLERPRAGVRRAAGRHQARLRRLAPRGLRQLRRASSCCPTSRGWSSSTPATTTSPRARRPTRCWTSFARFVDGGARAAARRAHRLRLDQAQPVARGADAAAMREANEMIARLHQARSEARLHRHLHQDARRPRPAARRAVPRRRAAPQRRRLRAVAVGDRARTCAERRRPRPLGAPTAWPRGRARAGRSAR